MTESIAYMKAEESFKKGVKKRGRPAGRHLQNKFTQALKRSSVEYFRYILTDENEKELWMAFITGKMKKRDVRGTVIKDADGFPVIEDVEMNAIQWAAFKRAVEYKRGLPIVTVEAKGEKDIHLEVNCIGATPQFFEMQAQALRLTK